jgi:superkiller protein 3
MNNKVRIAEIYSEIGDEEQSKFTPQGWKNAILCYNTAGIIDETNLDYYSKLILSYISLQKYLTMNLIFEKDYLSVAKRLMKASLNLGPTHRNTIIALANLYYAENNYDKATQTLHHLKSDTLNTNFNTLLLKLKLYRIKNDEIILYNKNLFKEHELSYLYNVIAENLIKEGNYKEAIEYLHVSLTYKKDNAFTLNKLGMCHYYLERYNTAVTKFKEALSVLPDFIKVYTNIAKSRVAMGNFRKAIRSLNRAIQINPNLYTAYNDLGVIYYKKKMFLSSIRSYRKAVEINPDYYIAYNNLGISLKEIENYEDSEQAYKKAIQLNPNYSQAYNNLGTLLNKLNRHKEAIECYKRALHINPKYKNAYLNLEKVYDHIESTYFA